MKSWYYESMERLKKAINQHPSLTVLIFVVVVFVLISIWVHTQPPVPPGEGWGFDQFPRVP